MGRHRIEPTTQRGSALKKVRALFIGCLVFGIGGTLTLATWTDSEYASGNFATSVFGIEGRSSGSDFSSQKSDSSAALMSFVADGLSPDSVVYAPFDVRTTNRTTVNGTVRLDSVVLAGDRPVLDNLSYRIAFPEESRDCSSAPYTGSFLPVQKETIPADSTQSMAHSVSRNPSWNVVRYCFQVKLAQSTPNEAQGKTGMVTWKFVAMSSE